MRHLFLILTRKVALEFMTLFCIVSLVYIEYQLAGIDSFDKAFKFSIVRMRRVWYLEVEWQVLVILIIPASENDEDGRLFSIAFVYAINRNKEREL